MLCILTKFQMEIVLFVKFQDSIQKLKDGAVPVFLPGQPSICSQSIASTKRRRVSPTSKYEEMFNEALALSLHLRAKRKRNISSIVSRISKLS